MRSQLLLSLGLTTLATAQFSINRNEEETVVQEINTFLATATSNPELQTLDIPALERIAPTSAILAAETDPANLIEAIVADATNPTFIAAVPTPLADSLRKILAQPLKAVADTSAYLDQLLKEPGVAQALQGLGQQVLPPELQQQVQSAPVVFLENLVTATTVPVWVSGLPAPAQAQLASVLDQGLSIVDADFRATATAVGTGAVGTGAVWTGVPPAVVVSASGAAPYPITTRSAPLATGTRGWGLRGVVQGRSRRVCRFWEGQRGSLWVWRRWLGLLGRGFWLGCKRVSAW